MADAPTTILRSRSTAGGGSNGGVIQFPVTISAERKLIVDEAIQYIRRLDSEDILALIPVLARHAAPEET